MNKTLTALALEAGLRPFDQLPMQAVNGRGVGDLAAALLGDRNLYFTKEYRERFATRVHSLEVSPQRLLLGAVESAQPPTGQRRFRAVIFRCDGEVIYQTPDNRLLDQHAANVDLRYAMQHVDEQDVLKALCVQQVKVSARLRDGAERVMASMHKQSP